MFNCDYIHRGSCGQDINEIASLTSFDAEKFTATVDLSRVYAKFNVSTVQRSFCLVDDSIAVVTDSIQSDAKRPPNFTWRMHTAANVTLDGHKATLVQDGVVLVAVVQSKHDLSFTLSKPDPTPPERPINGINVLMIEGNLVRDEVFEYSVCFGQHINACPNHTHRNLA